MKRQHGFSVFEILVVIGVGIIILAGTIGWVWNIVKIVQTFDAVLTGMFIARCIGVFVAPIGSVLGFL